jgi:putative ABC transport system ATP-binding protein
MNNLIVGEDIVKIYGEGDEQRRVLDQVSLTIEEGEFMAVMGPSGSGKTTLMFALSGMDGLDGGRVAYRGRNLAELDERELSDLRRNEMGFVFQQPTLLKNLNILDNIILPALRNGKESAAQLTRKARALMKRMGIESLEKRDITQASGGQLQRAGICRALMGKPSIIFGDEPTGALNSKSAEEIMDIFAQIVDEGTAVMLVTHDAKVAARTQHILFMRDGKIVSELRFLKKNSPSLDQRLRLITERMREVGI